MFGGDEIDTLEFDAVEAINSEMRSENSSTE